MNQFGIADTYLHPSVNIYIFCDSSLYHGCSLIHVKTFHILYGEDKLCMKDIAEQLFTVCAYLVNFQSPIVKK
jgi:hypothetical protein